MAVPILLKGFRRIYRSASQCGEGNDKSDQRKQPGSAKSTLAAFVGHIYQAFLKLHVTLPKVSVSPSLMGVALSGSRRLPLTRVAFVLFRSVTV